MKQHTDHTKAGMTQSTEQELYEQWRESYALRDEPNYSVGTDHDCKAAFIAGMQAARRAQVQMPEPEKLALDFHESYERLAPSFGYEARQETRDFNPESANGKLMIAVCAELLAAHGVK